MPISWYDKKWELATVEQMLKPLEKSQQVRTFKRKLKRENEMAGYAKKMGVKKSKVAKKKARGK